MKRSPAAAMGSPTPKAQGAGAKAALPPPALQDVLPAEAPPPVAVSEVRTLAIDVGGTRLKAGVLDPSGALVAGPVRTDTPHPSTPARVLEALRGIIAGIGSFDRISVGFPGVTRSGRVLTAPNLGNDVWKDFPLVTELVRLFGKPVRLTNDAIVQGLGVISGRGVELVLTLGTGMGFALFQDGMISPHVEMGQHMARGKKSYDHYIGNLALETIGAKKWNNRLKRVIEAMRILANFDALLIGGGNAKHIDFELPPRVRVVPNEAGITGGVRLWDAKLDSLFAAGE